MKGYKFLFLIVFFLGISISIGWSQTTITKSFSVKSLDQIQNGYFTVSIPIENKDVDVKVLYTNWLPISSVPIIEIDKLKTYHTFSSSRKKTYIDIHVPAYQNVDGTYRQLTQVEVAVNYLTEPQPDVHLLRPTYPTNSVLKTGKWYKIGVTQQGVYKIDAQVLNDLGINIASINPKNMRVYGTGGQVMTEHPDDSEPNDLVENAIFLSTAGTTFSSTDYALFYTDGLVKWRYNSSTNTFIHTNNYFSDTAYYFITFDLGPGKRIANAEVPEAAPMITFDTFNDYTVIDQDSVSYSNIGKVWWSHIMYSQVPSSLTKNLQLKLISPVDSAIIDYQVGSNVFAYGSQMKIELGSNELSRETFNSLGADNYLSVKSNSVKVPLSSNVLNFTLRFTPISAGIGALDFIRVNTISNLNFNGLQRLKFRNVKSQSYLPSEVVEYKLANVPSSLQVWKVTNPLQPQKVTGSISTSQFTFKDYGGAIHEYYAIDGTNYLKPTALGSVSNQNLHGLAYADLLIITHPNFVSIAQKIADLHTLHDGITSHIVTVDKIFNEFSSGSPDIAGIRNFIRMFYDRAVSESDIPKNVLILGNGSFDYKNRISNNTNYVPIYQSYNSFNKNSSFSTDDYYALLDSMEVLNSGARFDIGIGRIPINSIEEGEDIVKKMENYLSPNSYGPWKNNFTFLSDNGDGAGNFVRDNEIIAEPLKMSSPIYNFTKLYADDYTPSAGAAGNFYPQLTSDLNNNIFLGTFLLNYAGHGGPQKLADENILTKDDIIQWRNYNKLPVVITGTCDFSRFDNPDEYFAGVLMFMKNDGGSIASLTTTQPVHSGGSTSFIRSYIEYQFNKDEEGNIMTIGEAIMNGKNLSGGAGSNNIRYILLGDPALKLALPKFNVSTDSLHVFTSATTTELTDTISALGKYRLYGSVKDYSGMVRSDFNGKLFVIFYDKPTDKLINIPAYPSYTSYEVQNNIVYKGEVKVNNGEFVVEMVIPKDIQYDFGKGKISYYAMSDTEDAAGADTNLIFGGFAHYFEEDNAPPIVEVYIDDEKFRDGGVVGPDPVLYVKLYDDNGINATGSSIGHDIIGILDGNTSSPYILNSYYSSVENDYRNGYVLYPLSGLSEGMHEIRVRAWDVHNNSGEGKITFRVVKKDQLVIGEVYNYPNPVYESHTNFVIQHNVSNENLEITIDIYDNMGKNVRKIQKDVAPGGNRIEVLWDCRDLNNMDLPKGLYNYVITVRTESGLVEQANNKLVIVK